jgi:hypothetical protein
LIKNRWRWDWLEKKTANFGVLIGSYCKKMKAPGRAVCIRCNAEISYGSLGHVALVSHEGNYRIPGKLAYSPSFLLISNIVQVKIK